MNSTRDRTIALRILQSLVALLSLGLLVSPAVIRALPHDTITLNPPAPPVFPFQSAPQTCISGQEYEKLLTVEIWFRLPIDACVIYDSGVAVLPDGTLRIPADWVLEDGLIQPRIPTPGSARALVRTHPRLKHICLDAGGCGHVFVNYWRYDGTGDLEGLKNKVSWRIDASVQGHYISGYGSVKGSPHAGLESAITDWDVDRNKTIEPVPPHEIPCDANCFK